MIKLPMADPVLTTIPSHSNFLTISLLQESGRAWLANFYVNIYLRYVDGDVTWLDSCKANFLDWGTLDRNYSNLVSSFFIPRQFVGESIIDFVKKSLENQYYIILRLDEFYIGAYSNFNKRHRPHCAFINGIDIEKKIILVSDFFYDGRYQTVELKFEEFLLAYESVEENQIPREPDYQFLRSEIQLLKANYSYYKFSLKQLWIRLNDYHLGKDSTGRFTNTAYLFDSYNEENQMEYLYGINSIVKIAELFCERKMGIQNIHMLYDRYKAMSFRLRFLSEKYPDMNLKSTTITYEEIEKQALNLRNLCLKYTITNSEKDKNNIIAGYQDVKDKETLVIKELIDEVHKFL